MRRTRSLTLALAVLTAALLSATLTGTTAASSAPSCPKPSAPLRFAPQTFVDTGRAGGEPTVETHPDGTLLYSAHASTTLFYSPEIPSENSVAYPQNYRGQTYLYWSSDHGTTWNFAPRNDAPTNVPLTGFSDPEFAIDSAGTVYESEINLVNVAVSASNYSGRSYQLQNFFGQVLSDRQWMEADRPGVVYMVGNNLGGGTFPTRPVGNNGHTLYRSTDAGKSWSEGLPDGNGLGDLQVDKRNGALYEAYYDASAGLLSLAAYRGARAGDMTLELNTVAEGVDMLAHWPSFDVDPAGNLYMVWDESGGGGRPAGIWLAYSKTRGKTWSKPVKVNESQNTALWPWLAVGAKGKVALAWFEASAALPDHDAETVGDHEWRVVAAQTLTGLGCRASRDPSFRVTVATPDPIHSGTMCQGGTTCQAQLIDRRLGDFFTIEIDSRGRMYAGYSDTSRGGMVALPGFVRQVGGPSFGT